MKYNPDIHHRKSVRIKGYDYSKEGMYFITICTQNRECILGTIKNEKSILNDYGKIINEEILKTNEIRQNAEINNYIIMPNHVHMIIEINEKLGFEDKDSNQGVCNTPLQSPSQTIGAIVRSIKGKISSKIGYRIWQKNYYEHIIRNEKELYKIQEYIQYNPLNWDKDKFNC